MQSIVQAARARDRCMVLTGILLSYSSPREAEPWRNQMLLRWQPRNMCEALHNVQLRTAVRQLARILHLSCSCSQQRDAAASMRAQHMRSGAR